MTAIKDNIALVSIPFDGGAGRLGCRMGPDALKTAGLEAVLHELGYSTSEISVGLKDNVEHATHPNATISNLGQTKAWMRAISKQAYLSSSQGLTIFAGGDHTISAGTVSGVAQAAKEANKPLYVLWLDAHTDFHSLDTTDSGNLHGTPVAYFTGQKGFEGYYPPLDVVVPEENVCILGLRSVDESESARLLATKIIAHDMRAIDEHGMVKLLKQFIEVVKNNNGWLHVSLDVDFLDPEIAPAVGTTVPGGANFREAHLIMELLFESQLLRSLDLAELNPFLDIQGKTANLLVDLTASLFGKRIMDRVTRSAGVHLTAR